MKKISLAFLILLLLIADVSARGLKLKHGKYNVDPAHTRVSFIIDHFVVSQVQGRFNDVKGSFTFSDQLADSKLEVTIPVASIDTAVKQRDDHLRSPDFFDVAKYPDMTFKSKKFSGSFEKFKMTGDLTIKDVTKEVTLDGKYTGSVKDPTGKIRAAAQATGKINRKDFHINYNEMIELGAAVGNEVTIKILTEGIYEE